MSKQSGIALLVTGIILIVVGILLFIPQTCINVYVTSICYAPYAGIGVLLVLVGIVLIIIGAILAGTANQPATPQYYMAPMMAPVMTPGFPPQYSPGYAAAPPMAPGFQPGPGFCASCGSANPGAPICRFCARPTG